MAKLISTHLGHVMLLSALWISGIGGSEATETEQRAQFFNGDPIWEESGNRLSPQNFGFSHDTQNAGGVASGEAGGHMERGEPAWYADPLLGEIDPAVDALMVTGRMMIENAGNPSFGYFDNAWTGPGLPSNALMFRIDDNNIELMWRADGAYGRQQIGAVTYGTPFDFEMTYDPIAGDGQGTWSMSLDGGPVQTMTLNAGAREQLTLDRFGLFNLGESAGHGCRIWMDDLEYTVQAGIPTPTPKPTPTPLPVYVPLQRQESFDADPGWDGHNNRYNQANCRTTVQNFGYSAGTHHTGGVNGEMGGWIQPGADPAYYAKVIPTFTFNDSLTASGKLCLSDASANGQANIGFFNADTALGWRTPNSLFIRILGRGGYTYLYAGYMTQYWRAGEDVLDKGAQSPGEFAVGGAVHNWTLTYDPEGNGGQGRITFTLSGETVICDLDPGHKNDGATFNRFGLVNMMKSNDSGMNIWLDDLTINGQTELFSSNPGWEAHQNKRTYTDCIVRANHDFGYSPTDFTGTGPGEMGGLIFRGDDRYPEKMAYYADTLSELDLERPLVASGTVNFQRGITDAGTLIGFFHHEHSVRTGDNEVSMPPDFLGVMIDGPSSDGFYFFPNIRSHGSEYGRAYPGPYLLPDGQTHDWRMEYDPKAAGGNGRLTVTLDEETVAMDLDPGLRAEGAHFDRFGMITTSIDGNYHYIYFDDLSYTYDHELKVYSNHADSAWLKTK